MVEIMDLDRITPADRTNLDDVIRELDETRMLCKKLNAVIENTPDGIYVTDGEANAIRINPAFERISGLNREKMLGVNHRVLEENNVVAKSSSLMVVKERKQVTIIHEYLQTGLQALVTSTPVFDENGEMGLIVSSTRDLTELNVLKDELEIERERLLKSESMLEHMQAQMLNSQPIVSADKKMQDLLYMAARIAVVDSTVLITGETGTGKEGMAKYIHASSPRKKENFIAINCGAIPENLVESELFGYEKGAFTGARTSGKPGIFELAEHGTVFLDEVGELSLGTQAKLLRAIESRNITRVGGVKTIDIDVRILAATNRNLKEMIRQGAFREDLFYRLNVVPIHIPALRERKDDIIPLVKFFLDEINTKYNLHKKFTNGAYRVLHQYHWPGNIRELKNVVERMVVTSSQETIREDDLFFGNPQSMLEQGGSMPIKERLERIEYAMLAEAYEKYGNVRDAAKSLQMPNSTYVRKKKQYYEKYGVPILEQENQKWNTIR